MIRRVLMTADAVGGVWNYALELARGLLEHGIEVELAVMGPAPAEDQRAAADRVKNLHLHCREYDLEWMANPWADVEEAGEWLRELESKTRPDLVHLNGYAHGALAWRAPVLIAAHSCVLSWWKAVHGQRAPRHWDRYRSAVRAGLEGADAVVAPTIAMGEALREEYGTRNACVIFNGMLPGNPDRNGSERVILSAGRMWDEAKNLRALTNVAPQLAWPVRLAGDGGADAENVQALGRIGARAVAAEMAKAPIYCAPARYEPFGLSILEAAAAGCALVLGDIPSLRELWAGAALFVNPDDSKALERELTSLIEDSDFREDMAERAEVRASRYSRRRMIDNYLALYQSMEPAWGAEDGRLQEN